MACLVMIARHHGLMCEINDLYHLFPPAGDKGVSMYAINKAASSLGFKARALRLDYNALLGEVSLPCICHWDHNHFVVVSEINERRVTLLDPAMGRISYSRKEFCRHWAIQAGDCGTALELIPRQLQSSIRASDDKTERLSLKALLRKYRNSIIVICLILAGIGALNLGAPFLTQWMFDSGLMGQNINIVILALLAQLFIIIGKNVFQYLQSRLSLYVGNHIGLSLKRRLLDKFIRLPRRFFDHKGHGEVLQLSIEASNTESFLTNRIPGTLTSIVTVLISSCLLLWYDRLIFMIYVISLACYYIWIKAHLARKRKADNLYFAASANERDKMIQFVQGINDIKLSANGDSFIRRWKRNYDNLYEAGLASFIVQQRLSVGVSVIAKLTEISVILITVLAVMEGRLTVGAMMAIQYVVGSLEYPSQEIITFFRYIQDFKISISRLNGIYTHGEEMTENGTKVTGIPPGGIILSHVNFKYDVTADDLTLQDINLHIKEGKTTAIVGTSGSGKSTLLRIILGFYTPINGTVLVGDTDMRSLDVASWRTNCGFCGPENYVFNDTLLFNITLREGDYDEELLLRACRLAELEEVIESTPLGLAAMAGHNGDRLSNGQRQRLLLARALYSKPALLILDEATNSLDAITEKKIYDNLQHSLGDTTVIIAAHRLSTIKDADTIVVFRKGKIVETGSHDTLISQGGHYQDLINNQLTQVSL